MEMSENIYNLDNKLLKLALFAHKMLCRDATALAVIYATAMAASATAQIDAAPFRPSRKFELQNALLNASLIETIADWDTSLITDMCGNCFLASQRVWNGCFGP